MPELAEVEIARRNLERWWDIPASEVVWHEEKLASGDQERVTQALKSPPIEFSRRGKHLLFETEKGNVYVHFRMSGKIVRRDTPTEKYARLSWRVGDHWLSFCDFRRLGEVWFYEVGYAPEPWETIGPEPTDVTVEHLESAISDRRMLKAALLDQNVLAGVGNIAVSEVFWTLGFAPGIKWGALNHEQKGALVEELPKYFNWVIEEQEADEIYYTGEPGRRGAGPKKEPEAENPFTVYQRDGEPCPRCGTEIVREIVASRSSYFCPQCQ